jgi:hypothetical protein
VAGGEEDHLCPNRHRSSTSVDEIRSAATGSLDTLRRPVRRRRWDAPYIIRLLERQPQEPKFLVWPHRNTVYCPRSYVGAYGKALQAHRHPNFQATSEPYSASLGIHQDDEASVGKGLSRIEAGKRDRNLARNSSAATAPRLFGYRSHIQVYRFATPPQRCRGGRPDFVIRVCISNQNKGGKQYVRNKHAYRL